MRTIAFAIILTYAALASYAQDTVKVMTYNVLNYGTFTSYCTISNNDPIVKEENLRTIIEYASPDVFAVNEVSGSTQVYAQRMLDSVLNRVFPGRYAKGNFYNTTSSSLANMLYYDSGKFAMKQQWSLNDGIRDVCFFRLYYKSPALLQGDTAFITFISMHLKAGSTSTDESDRASQTLALMNYINSSNLSGNVLVMGDFNVYTSNEACFQNLINYSVNAKRFYDPINKLGDWNNSSSFANYHTQSASAVSNDCTASGGLDDRFDFILINEAVKYGTAKVSYVPSSYTTIGQDGNHFNLSVSDNTNTSAPSTVIDALQIVSDHLPVTLKLKINQTSSGISGNNYLSEYLIFNSNGSLTLPNIDPYGVTDIYIFDITGRMVTVKKTTSDNPEVFINELKPGIYILSYSSQNTKRTFKIATL